jgi:hypothetical protein
MDAAFQVVRPRAKRCARRVGRRIRENGCLSEPLRPDERGEEVDDDGGSDRDRDVSHCRRLSDVFAGDGERQADAYTREPEHEHRREPNEQIHHCLLRAAGAHAPREAAPSGNGGPTPRRKHQPAQPAGRRWLATAAAVNGSVSFPLYSEEVS